MKTASDLMTKNPIKIQSGWSLKEALDCFIQNHLHFSPVVTPLNEVLGLLSDYELVKAAIRNFLEPGRQSKVNDLKKVLIKPDYIQEDASLHEIVKHIGKAPSHRLLVLNKNKKLTGIISPKDVLLLLGGEEKKTEDLIAELERTRNQADELSEKIEDLEESLEVYQHLFKNSPYMMHSIGPDATIRMVNEKMMNTLGYEEQELIGKPLSMIYPKSVVHEALAGLEEIKEKGHHNTLYTSMQKKNGEKIRIDIGSSALRNNSGDFLGTISISREIDAEALLRTLNGIAD